MPKLTGKVSFRDNNGKVSEMSVPLGPGDDIAGALTALLNLVPFLASVSDASIYRAELVFTQDNLPSVVPGPLSDVARAGVLFYRNGDDTASVLVPSIAFVHLESTGPYASQRLTRESATVSGVLSALDNLLTGCLDDLGRAYGGYFIVGGVTRL